MNIKELEMTTAGLSKDEITNKSIVDNAFTIGFKRMANIPIDRLCVDIYQRPLEESTVSMMRQEWHNERCDTIVVSYRDDKFYIIDGSNRVEGARLNGIEELPCDIRTGLTIEDEARIFAEQYDNFRKIPPFYKYHADLIRNDRYAIILKEVCDKYEVNITETQNSINIHTLGSIPECKSIIKFYGKTGLDWVFKLIEDGGFSIQSKGYAVGILRTFRNIYASHKNFDLKKAHDRISEVLLTMTPQELIKKGEHTNDARTMQYHLETLAGIKHRKPAKKTVMVKIEAEIPSNEISSDLLSKWILN